jgi:hypothetical protein
LQASLGTLVPPVVGLLVAPAVVLSRPALPAVVAEPPLLERAPALARAFGSTVLLLGSLLQANATPISSVADKVIELDRRRVRILPHLTVGQP